ncbi:MAG: PAS domain S-box protein [Rhodanobacteraceae bacterium]
MNKERETRDAPGANPVPYVSGRHDPGRRQQFVLKLADAMRTLSDTRAIETEVDRRLAMHLGADRAFYGDVSAEGIISITTDYCNADTASIVGQYRLDAFGGHAADALRSGRTLVFADVAAAEMLTAAEKQACRDVRVAALVKVPRLEHGRLVAVLAVHQSQPRNWQADEIALVEDVAERTWVMVERARAETTLRLSEERYRSLFDGIDEGFCVMELVRGDDGRIKQLIYREVNAAFERLTGLHDVIGKSSSVLFPGLEGHWLDAIAGVMETGKPVRMENYQACPERWCSLQYSRVGGAGSRFAAAVFEDVTARKRAEEALSRLAAIVEFSDDAVIRKDLDGIIQTWNAGAERMFGYAASEVIGKSVTILMPPDRVDEEPGILACIRRGERVSHYETVRQRKDGSLLDISLSVSPIVDQGGTVVAASKIARDVTERKRAENALRASEERQGFLLMISDAMREQPDERAIGEVCVRMLAAHLHLDRCCVIRMSRGEDRLWPGPAFQRGERVPADGPSGDVALSDFPQCLRQLTTEPVVTKGVADDARFSGAEAAAMVALDQAAFIVVPIPEGERDFIWGLVAASGTPRAWTREEERLVEGAAERAWAFIERARVAAALHESEAKLQRASHAKDEFIAMLGHELRNPLAPITTTLALMELRAPDALVRERAIIEGQVRYLTGLVDDLLDVARIARGKIELKLDRVDVGEIVAVAVETTQSAIEERRQTLHVRVDDGVAVSGDRRRLVQVLVNLLTNAAKYSPPDRNIYLSAGAEEGQAVVRVRDEGQGIVPELLQQVFELFSQGSQSIDRSRGGLGLGLAIVRNLVELHGGSVTAASDGAYKGSEFTVRLPLLDSRPVARGQGVEVGAPRRASAEGRDKRVRVLIVDDYALAADSLAMLLQEMGYRTCVARDGAEALQSVKSFRPHVALVDIGLPVIDGYEVAQSVRGMPDYQHLPLVAVTGYGQASDRARVMKAGFNEHLVKPLDAAKIGELIERLVAAK